LEHRAVRVAALIAAGLQIPINALTWQRPRTLWPSGDGNPALDPLGWPGRAYGDLLPAVRIDGVDGGVAPALLVAAAITLLIVAAGRRPAAASRTP
jgi:hypothetical protein